MEKLFKKTSVNYVVLHCGVSRWLQYSTSPLVAVQTLYIYTLFIPLNAETLFISANSSLFKTDSSHYN